MVFCTEAPLQCKLDINMSDVVGDSKGLDSQMQVEQLNVRTVMVVLGTLVVHLNDQTL